MLETHFIKLEDEPNFRVVLDCGGTGKCTCAVGLGAWEPDSNQP